MLSRKKCLPIKAALADRKKVVRVGFFLVLPFSMFEKSIVVAVMAAWAEAVQGQGWGAWAGAVQRHGFLATWVGLKLSQTHWCTQFFASMQYHHQGHFKVWISFNWQNSSFLGKMQKMQKNKKDSKNHNLKKNHYRNLWLAPFERGKLAFSQLCISKNVYSQPRNGSTC